MKLTFISNSYPAKLLTGGQLTMMSFAKFMVRRGHTAHIVLTHTIPAMSSYAGIPMSSWSDFRELAGADSVLGVVVCQLSGTPAGVELAKERNAPLVQMVHGDDEKSIERLKMGADLAILCSNALVWIAELTQVRYRVMYPLVDLPECANRTRTHVTLVNLSKDKGSEIFYGLADEFPDVPFLGVTGGHEVQDLRCKPNVQIIGPTNSMGIDVYSRTKVLLIPSRFESFGRVGVEALGCGVPVIAANTPGLCESISDSESLIHTLEMSDWRSALYELLELPSGQLRVRIKKGEERFRSLCYLTLRQMVEVERELLRLLFTTF